MQITKRSASSRLLQINWNPLLCDIILPSPAMARILHLISQLEEGGAQRFLSDVITHSVRHEVEVASLISSPKEKLFPFYRNPNIPVHYLSDSEDFYYAGIMTALRRLLKKQKYEVVQCWMFESIVQGILTCRMENIPCIAFPQSMRIMLNLNRSKLWERKLVQHVFPLADLTIFPSYSTSLDFVHAGWSDARRVRVSRYGVDCNHFQPQGNGTAIVAVGRLSSEKAFDVLERIITPLQSAFPNVRCLVAGGGTPPSSSNLEHIGYVEDIRNVYKQAAVYMSTSWVEGLSLALLESQAMGIPAVMRKIGPNSEVIEHGVNGFLVTSEKEYVEACTKLLEDETLRREMGIHARARMLRYFSIEKQVEEMEFVQDELL
jgi:glycosyltransferase involved in cell wall biosynthesis